MWLLGIGLRRSGRPAGGVTEVACRGCTYSAAKHCDERAWCLEPDLESSFCNGPSGRKCFQSSKKPRLLLPTPERHINFVAPQALEGSLAGSGDSCPFGDWVSKRWVSSKRFGDSKGSWISRHWKMERRGRRRAKLIE